MKFGYVYCHLNKINGKRYIGQTIRKNVNDRWRCGIYSYKNSSLFYNAIKKYGWENFEHIILVKAPIEELDDLERFYINKFHTTNTKYGYNLQGGGKSNKTISDSTREKLRIAGKRPCKESTKEKIRQKQIGRHNSIKTEFKVGHKNLSKKWTEESKQKLSKFRTGMKVSLETLEKMRHVGCKPVLQYDKNMNFISYYYSAHEASRINNINIGNIAKCCNGKLKTYKGYIWRYK